MKKLNRTQMVVGALNGLSAIAPGLVGRIAFKLFCKPRRKKTKKSEFHFLATADLTYEQVDGRKYAVWHWGFKGPTALLVHGWESHSGRWRKMVPLLLNAGYQVIAIDAPAHGRSDGNRFTMLEYGAIIRYVLQKAAPVDLIIGHSVGATSVAWALGTMGAANRPKKAVLLAPFTTLRYTMYNSTQKLGISDRVMDAAVVQIEKFAQMPFDDIDVTRHTPYLSDLDVLVIHDKEDLVTDYTESVQLHKAWPGSELLLTEGFGHGLTAPEVYDTIGRYIREEVGV